jgi:NTE family protein
MSTSLGVAAMKIDGVFSGGGLKGYALIGAYEEIEKRGFQFERLAGTSAGAIVAALIAAGYTSQEIHQMIDELDIKQMLDERKSFIPFSLAKWIYVYWRLGLYKGDAFEKWMEEKLAAKGLKTFSDLPQNKLRVVASDLSNGQLIVLPDDLEKYGISSGAFSISKAIRMSCSIPYFFEPVKMRSIDGINIIVDGGVLSNFPIWIFENEEGQKIRPVLGIKLNPSEHDHEKHRIQNGIQLFGALFETMKDAHDARYISKRHAKNIIFIPAQWVPTIEFTITEEKKRNMYQTGKEYAENFLKTWTY